MSIYQRIGIFIVEVVIVLISFCTLAYSSNNFGMKHVGVAQMTGNVVSTPCSIRMKDRYQLISFSSLTLDNLSTVVQREQTLLPFDIELHDCGSVYSRIDTKTWTIQFQGQPAENISAFVLQGPSQGLGVALLDNDKQVLTPGQIYPLYNSVSHQDKAGQILVLRYFLQLELTGKPIKEGNYNGLIRFFINYQ
ncbi:type 1 fimbrial protein [Proteus vulgaris]|uniref:fimbrial protein n=1 Tax=Proteus faecis TaxID=2050967 RepID=UPI00163C57E6|nr:type 1 fimbrial protein [Proteus vulgaris]